MIGLVAIVGGYASLLWMFGWSGLLVGVAHFAILALGLWRRPK